MLAAGDQEAFEYILNWTAWALQNPGKPAEVVLVFKGGRGTGKGLFGRVLRDVFGQHGRHISSATHLAGRFNAHFADTAFLFADEAFWPGDKSAEGSLKRMITEPTLFIERKGVDAYEVANALKIMMASNEAWVVPAGMDERRFAVFEVSEEFKQSAEYFDPAIRRDRERRRRGHDARAANPRPSRLAPSPRRPSDRGAEEAEA